MQSATKCETLVSKPDKKEKRCTMVVTNSVRAALTGLGALAVRGQMMLKACRASQAVLACFLKASSEVMVKLMSWM